MSPQDHAVEHLAPSGQCCCGAFGRRALAGSNQSLGATLKVIAEPDPNLELSHFLVHRHKVSADLPHTPVCTELLHMPSKPWQTGPLKLL